MPNHVTNTMLVFGPKAEVEQAFALVWRPKNENEEGLPREAGVDFGLARPLPAALEGTTAPTSILTEERLVEAQAEREEQLGKNPQLRELGLAGEAGITQAEANRRLTEYGALNWYDWQVANWGTKWNAYNCELEQEVEETDKEGQQFGFVVRFDTAWAPPTGWIDHLLHKLQGGVVIEMISVDEGDRTSPILYTSQHEDGYPEHLVAEVHVEVAW